MDTDHAQQQQASKSPQAGTSSSGKSWSPIASLVSIILAIVAGAAVWLLIQTYYPVFLIPPELRGLGQFAPLEQWIAREEAIAEANQKNAILVLAVLGGGLGIAMGLAGGLVQRSLKLIVMTAVAAGILGCLFGGLGSFLTDLAYDFISPPGVQISLLGTSIVQIFTLGLLGAGIGMGLGLALGSSQPTIESVLFGLLAGALAGLLCPITTALVLPDVPTLGAIPVGATSQILWIMLTAISLGLILPMAGSRPNTRGGAG